MACFVAPMAEAIIVTAVAAAIKKREKKALAGPQPKFVSGDFGQNDLQKTKISWSRKLSWLSKLLWGGVFLLAVEHIWHGEVVPWPPFLTAMSNPADIPPMLHEIATVGTAMALTVTVIWIAMVLIADHNFKRVCAPEKAQTAV